tara:strand:+ start:2139 stop:2588 length:450 start_codon:yes stop_codon:yes gene_type:complete
MNGHLYDSSSNIHDINKLLENEMVNNKKNVWIKLDKKMKTQKLHIYAEKYGKEHSLSMKQIKQLKIYFSSCLDQQKLQKTKDISYNKETGEITSIPMLFFNVQTNNFTLKQCDKHVSTIKSLTPKRLSKKSDKTDKNGLENIEQEKKLK